MSVRETFDWAPQTGMNGTVKYRVLRAQVGDGVLLGAGDGIHNRIESWRCSFNGTSD